MLRRRRRARSMSMMGSWFSQDVGPYCAGSLQMGHCMRSINVSTIWIATLVAVIVASAPREASTQNFVNSSRELVIATKEAPPFAMKAKDGSWSGISIELWQRIANQAQVRYKFVESATIQSLLDGITDGSFDAGIA